MDINLPVEFRVIDLSKTALFCILILGIISNLSMYSTDGGEFLYHSKSHFIRFIVFFTMMISLSFISLRFWHSSAYFFYAIVLAFLVWASLYGVTASGSQNVGDPLNAASFKTIADAAQEVQAFGGGANVTGENCWGTAAADTKRTVYQYGTYNAGNLVTADADKKYDASQGSMSLRATKGDNASFPDDREVYAHASYWGSHVDSSDRSLVSDTTVFRNNNSSTDTNTYNLKQNFLQVLVKTLSLLLE